MKILIIASGDLWAGAEAMVSELAEGLYKNKNDVYIITFNHGKLSQKCIRSGIRTQIIDEKKNIFISILLKSIKISMAIRPDIIHSHRYKENIISSFIQPFCGSPKLISTQHGRLERQSRSGLLSSFINFLNNMILNFKFNSIVAVSKDTRNYLTNQCRIKGPKISLTYNGINTNQFLNNDKYNDFKTIKIASAGRLFPVKNFSQMIDIAFEICKENNNVEFFLAGDGPERNALNRKISDLNMGDKFKLLGNINDMPAFYRGIDIYINTSFHEGTPMTVLESMASGKPVVAYNNSGLKEIITNSHDGFTVSAGDYKKFVETILQMCKQPEVIKKMGINARKTILKRFSSERMVSSYTSLYSRLLKNYNTSNKSHLKRYR